MKDAWYIAATSEEVGDTPLVSTLFGEDLLLWRTADGAAHALLDRCPHRGARLSDGQLRDGCVACPFHGWVFDGAGRCQLIPANGSAARIPPRAHAQSFPVCEAAGHVFVWLGPEPAAPLVLPPELTDPTWRAVPFQAHWEAHITRVTESVLDVSHLPFVHPRTTGDVDPQVDGPAFTYTDDEIVVTAKPFHPLVATPLNEEDAKGESTITFSWPNQMILRTDFLLAAERGMATWLCVTPINDEETQIYGLALRNFFTDVELLDHIHYEHNITVLDEDRSVVEGLRPKQSPLDLRQEPHVRSDAQQIRYRLMLRKKSRGPQAD